MWTKVVNKNSMQNLLTRLWIEVLRKRLAKAVSKIDDGEMWKRREKKERRKEIISEIVATNVAANQLPELRPTGTLTAHANTRLKGPYHNELFWCISCKICSWTQCTLSRGWKILFLLQNQFFPKARNSCVPNEASLVQIL